MHALDRLSSMSLVADGPLIQVNGPVVQQWITELQAEEAVAQRSCATEPTQAGS